MSIRKHTIYNFVGAVLPIGLSLFTIPIYIGIIGDARYGVLAIAWLLLGYFGLFDLGLGRATAQRIASISGGSSDELAATFWTALLINVSLGIIGGLIIWPVAGYFFEHVFNIDAKLRPELGASIPWLILAVPLATLSGVLTGALEGRAKFLELNIISTFSSALIQVMPLTVAWLYGPDLALLLPTVVLTRFFSLIFLFSRCKVHVFHRHVPTISKKHAKGLLEFGGWVTLTSLVGPMMVILDRLVIGSILGAKSVTYYTVPFQLAERSTILPGALTTALFPRMAAANQYESKKLATTAIRSLAVVMTPMMLLGVLLIQPFLRWWITPDFALNAGLTAQIFLLGFWINAFARVPYAQLQAAGKPALVAKCHLIELIPYLLLLYVGLHFWGLPGAALIFSLRTFADCVLLLWCAGTLKIGVMILKFPVVLLLTAFGVAAYIPTSHPLWWLATFCLMLISFAWSFKNAPPEIKNLLV